MNNTFETLSELNGEIDTELDYDTTYDYERDDLESDDDRFGESLAFCSPAFREIFG